MNKLSVVFVIKIAATVLFWCVPLICFPGSFLEGAGFPAQSSYLFVRMLGWAYLALCVGYAFGLKASLQGKRALGPIWAGIVSNGGACIYLGYFGFSGAWESWGSFIQLVGWGSMIASAGITVALIVFGLLSKEPEALVE